MHSPSPVRSHLGMVFIPVSDLRRSMRWYGALLGHGPQAATHEGKIGTFVLDGGQALLLDAHKPVRCSSQPLFLLWTDDLQRSLHHVESLPAAIVGDCTNVGSLSMFIFADPDGNRLMIGQRNACHGAPL